MVEYTNSQISYLIDEYIHNDLHRQILKSRYIDGLTYEQLAEKHDRSVKNIKDIIKKNENSIFKHLEVL